MVVTVLLGVLALLLLSMMSLWLVGERWHALLPSTWRMARAGGMRRLLNLDFLHVYVYGRWTNQYISFLLNRLSSSGDKGKKWFRDRYHGKVITEDQARNIVTIEKPIARDLDQVIPYPRARHFILDGPPDIAVFDCACRHARETHCDPTKVCMVVGQPFVDFIVEHHPDATRLTRDQALDLLRDEHERGHVHTAWFKDACLDRFYAICNCCKCCCGGIEAMKRLHNPIVLSSGYVARVDAALCNGCGECADTCAFSAMSIINDVAVRSWDDCMGCGVCVDRCALEAVTLVRDEAKGIPLDVKVLAAAALDSGSRADHSA